MILTIIREVAEVPDFVGRATPWMVALILIEGLVNHFHRWSPPHQDQDNGDDGEEEEEEL